MVATDKLFAGSIPEIYERFLVPLIFESYAIDLAKRVAKAEPQDVLETAAGTGVLTRSMVSHLPEAVPILATDLNQPMHDQAATRQLPKIVRSSGNRPMLWHFNFRSRFECWVSATEIRASRAASTIRQASRCV